VEQQQADCQAAATGGASLAAPSNGGFCFQGDFNGDDGLWSHWRYKSGPY